MTDSTLEPDLGLPNVVSLTISFVQNTKYELLERAGYGRIAANGSIATEVSIGLGSGLTTRT